MDSSHKCLVTWFLHPLARLPQPLGTDVTSQPYGTFQKYRCDKDIKVGINTRDLFEYLKLINDEDDITLRATEGSPVYELFFESPGNSLKIIEIYVMILTSTDHTRKGLIEIDAVSHLDDKVVMPEPSYDVVVRLGSTEFERIATTLSSCSPQGKECSKLIV
jgi:hypothetical protein